MGYFVIEEMGFHGNVTKELKETQQIVKSSIFNNYAD